MNFDLLAYEHLFELLNFLFLVACTTVLYRKYGRPWLRKALQDKKSERHNLKKAIVRVQADITEFNATIQEQETYAQHLLHTIGIWAKKEEQKKARFYKECTVLQHEYKAYTAHQEKAAARHVVIKEIMPATFASLRACLTDHYQHAEQQRKTLAAVASACATKGKQHG